MFGGLKRKIERIALSQIIGMLLKRAAEGEFGPMVKKLYDLVDGKKTIIGVIFTAIGALLYAADSSGLCEALTLPCGPALRAFSTGAMILGGLGIHIGQVGGALKLAPPTK